MGWQWHQLNLMQKSFAPCSRQITMPAPHHSIFYRLDALLLHSTNSAKALAYYISTYTLYIQYNKILALMCAQSASTLAVYWLGYWTCNLAVKSLIPSCRG